MKKTFRMICFVLALGFSGFLSAADPAEAQDPRAAWVNVTSNIGGENWGYAGVCIVVAVPDSKEIIAGISEQGLWSSADDGKNWTHLGSQDKEQIRHRPGCIVFDPKDPKIFWVSGCYGPSPFKTTDGGRSFVRLGDLKHTDGISIDFSDPERKTLLIGLHEQIRSLHKSSNGGATWLKIGDKLPEKSNHSTDPLAIDSQTFLCNAAGWAKMPWGIYRTEDGGETFTKVSDAGPTGAPLVASDGSIYWGIMWGGGLLQSNDQGKTWSKLNGPVKNTPIELSGGKLVALQDKQLFESSDQGKSWTPLGPQLPWKANGVAFSAKGKCFYCWRTSEKKSNDAIVRWQMPE